MIFKKVSITEKRGVEITYLDKENVFSVQSFDDYTPDFFNSIRSLGASLLVFCELPADYLPRVEVTGVTFSHSNEKEFFCLVARMLLDRRPGHYLNLVSPLVPVMPGMLQEMLEVVKDNAALFLNGSRQQVDLFDQH